MPDVRAHIQEEIRCGAELGAAMGVSDAAEPGKFESYGDSIASRQPPVLTAGAMIGAHAEWGSRDVNAKIDACRALTAKNPRGDC